MVVTCSSIEPEYRVLVDTTAKFIWLCCLLKDMEVPISSTTSIYCDN